MKSKNRATLQDPTIVASKAIEYLGGAKKAFTIIEEEHKHTNSIWNRDTTLIGRILRAHLFVEYFMNRYISKRYRGLGSIDDSRFTFAQKTVLLDRRDRGIAYLIPGIELLNRIRNRCAHTTSPTVSDAEAHALLQIPLFAAMRNELRKRMVVEDSPIDVLEAFAKHAGASLDARHSRVSLAFRKAIKGPRKSAGL